ncbi:MULTISPECIES: hypothetical protein [Streptomyces]|uniref:DUF2690 domain-containing protein n=1 Tax=Streptomyces albus (strain ATCC 21838 / DSM 41398 / FERM P-419 / JCM 4703 / NBRC 107858) TaxID=1081613 RepID=A0A0B5ETC7_STRA4|nr:hypothetical protein [Streptomyces sp. SCSIO ZS0520]AJE84934.1 hypothetical protein SLNWT_4558 [Streptomyces albus]AOU79239.1 hypothetical protein SLNHY_4548 [Streptomyces albus]AYN34970.1 hypothetical protein DUI70_4472 [Streptomyces albus]
MRARKTVLAAIACAAVLVPASSAFAGTGPAPAPDKQRSAKSTAPSAAGNPLSARAKAAGVCDDAYQIGTTAYIDRSGQHAASVKQFYSPDCKQNYSYVWVWQSFRDKVKDYDVSTSVYSYSDEKFHGKRSWADTNLQEFWSNPAETAGHCTAAVASLRAPGEPLAGQAATSKRC